MLGRGVKPAQKPSRIARFLDGWLIDSTSRRPAGRMGQPRHSDQWLAIAENARGFRHP